MFELQFKLYTESFKKYACMYKSYVIIEVLNNIRSTLKRALKRK